MFNDHQLLLLQEDRQRALAQEWRNASLRRQAELAARADRKHTGSGIKRARLRTLILFLLLALLTLGVTRIASAQAGLSNVAPVLYSIRMI